MKSSKKVTPPKTKSLRDLIDSVEWVGLATRGGITGMAEDAVSIHFTYKYGKTKEEKNASDNCDYVRVRIGKAVLEKLDWSPGNRIFISNDPDDQFTFLLCKVESTNGFKLGIESGSTAGRIQFAWRENYIPVKISEAQLVDYEIHKKHLIFRANPSA